MGNKVVGTLYIVATPIGNLSDITLRALETLKSVDMIACEDTRVSGNLLKHFEIKKPLVSLHQHSGEQVISNIIDELLSGKNIAYISDNGTPGISDPGQALIAQIRNSNIEIRTIPVPGPSALTASISISGMVEKEFYFQGFLPKKKGRQTKFKELANLDVPFVIYESASRVGKTLEDLKKFLGDKVDVFIAREITKVYEEYWDGTISEVLETLSKHTLKGEFVIIARAHKSEKVKVNKYAKDKG